MLISRQAHQKEVNEWNKLFQKLDYKLVWRLLYELFLLNPKQRKNVGWFHIGQWNIVWIKKIANICLFLNRLIVLIDILFCLCPRSLGFVRSLNRKIKPNCTFYISKTGLHIRLSKRHSRNIPKARLQCSQLKANFFREHI